MSSKELAERIADSLLRTPYGKATSMSVSDDTGEPLAWYPADQVVQLIEAVLTSTQVP
jgi:hypothetical protein